MQARYVKVTLFTECKTRLMDGKVVGQGEDYLLIERAQPKQRVTKKSKPSPKVKHSDFSNSLPAAAKTDIDND